MSRFLLLIFLLFPVSAQAQLKVESPPTSCAAGTVPVLGIAVKSVFEGEHGFDFSGELEQALQLQGYRVFPEYEYKLVEKATVLLEGRVDAWTSMDGTQTHRIGDARINVVDVDSERILLSFSQERARIVFQAPKLPDFVNMVVKEMTSRYCQLP